VSSFQSFVISFFFLSMSDFSVFSINCNQLCQISLM
jgi:hypothetical protein